MAVRISEPVRLFQLEQSLKGKSVGPFIKDIPDVTTLKLADLVSDIPLAWRDSESFFSPLDDFYNQYFFEEAQFKEATSSLWDYAIKEMVEVVHCDLAFWVAKLFLERPRVYLELSSKSSWVGAYRLLQDAFESFHLQSEKFFNREEQEIYVLRSHFLNYYVSNNNFLALKDEGIKKGRGVSNLIKEVEVILDFILALGEGESCLGDLDQWHLNGMLSDLEKMVGQKEKELSFEGAPVTPLSLSQIKGPFFSEGKERVSKTSKQSSQSERLFISRLIDIPQKIKDDKKRLKTVFQTFQDKMSKEHAQKAKTLLKGLEKNKVVKWGLKMFSHASTALDLFSEVAGAIGSLIENRSKHRENYRSRIDSKEGDPRVLEGVRIIFHQLDTLDEKMVVLSGNQKKLEERILFLEVKISRLDDNIRRVNELFLHELVLSRIGVSAILDYSGKICREIRLKMSEFDGYRPYYNRFVSFAAFQSFCAQEQFLIRQGLEGLPKLLMRPGEEDGALIVSSQRDKTYGLFTRHYEGLWAFLKQEKRFESGLQLFEFFLSTPGSILELEQMMQKYQIRKSPSLPSWMRDRLGIVSLDRLLGFPYAIDRLLDYSESARCFHYFYELFQDVSQSVLIPIENLESHRPSSVGRCLLEDAFIQLEVGIFQLNLISGIGLLPSLLEKLEEGKSKEVFPLLVGNKMLAHNLMVYAFRKRIEKKKRSLTDYYVSWSTVENPSSLLNLLGQEWVFTWDQNDREWKIRFSDQSGFLSLPSPTDVIEGRFLAHPQLGKLYLMRKKVLREIAGYQPKECQKEQKAQEIYQAGVVLNSIFFRTRINQQQRRIDGNKNRATCQSRL